MIQHAIFDMDGLLIDSEKIFFESFLDVLKSHNYISNLEDYKQFIGLRHDEMVTVFSKKYTTVDNPTQALNEIVDEATRRLTENKIPLKPGAFEILNAMKQRGISLSMATATGYESAHQHLHKAGLHSYFGHIVTGDEVKHSKPDPDVYLQIIAKLRAPVDQILVFEDSPRGVEAAYRAHLNVIQIPDLLAPDDTTKRQAFRIYPSLLDALKDLDSLLR